MDVRKSACVIIPAYNEEKSLPSLIQRTLKEVSHVIVVDDGSTDKTGAVSRESGATVVRNDVNSGKGASIIRGIKRCLIDGFSPAIIIDADGQHPPEKIPDFLEEIRKNHSDIVLGNRMGETKDMPFVRLLTNRFMSWFTSLLLGYKLHDTQCGYRLMSPKAMELHENVDFSCLRFDYETEILFYAVKKGLRISEVNIPTIYDSERKSRIHPVKDTLRWFKALFVIRKRAKEI